MIEWKQGIYMLSKNINFKKMQNHDASSPSYTHIQLLVKAELVKVESAIFLSIVLVN